MHVLEVDGLNGLMGRDTKETSLIRKICYSDSQLTFEVVRV
jgi:hypothetical protein